MHVIKVQIKLAEAKKTSMEGHQIILIMNCPNVRELVHEDIPISELVRIDSLNTKDASFSSLSDLNSTIYFFRLEMCGLHHLMMLYAPGLDPLTQFGKTLTWTNQLWQKQRKVYGKEEPYNFFDVYCQWLLVMSKVQELNLTPNYPVPFAP